jgi:hypothetical protein
MTSFYHHNWYKKGRALQSFVMDCTIHERVIAKALTD